MYNENKAEEATGPIKHRHPIARATPAPTQVALNGDDNLTLTTFIHDENGNPSSRAKAQICLEIAVKLA